MERKRAIAFSFGLALFIWGISPVHADDIANQISASRQSYAAGSYQSCLRNGLGAMDLVYQKQARKMLSLVPVPDGFTVFETNTGFSFSDQNGILDYSAQADVGCSNTNLVVRLTADTSLNNVERFINLIRSYDYLSDTSGYKKIVLKQKKSEWTYITESTDAYFIPVLNETNETVTSGLLLKVSFGFVNKMKITERDKMMEAVMKELILKINYREIGILVK